MTADRPLCCANCPFVDEEQGRYYCRRYPPTATPIIGEGAQRNLATGRNQPVPIKIADVVDFPQIRADLHWCGEHPEIQAAIARGESWVKPTRLKSQVA